MSKKAYSKEEREAVYQALLTTGRQLFARQGYGRTTLAQIYNQVGISKNFFYTFFPSKEICVSTVLDSQRPFLIEMAKKQMEKPGATWQDAIRDFLLCCLNGKETGIFIMTLTEQRVVFRNLSETIYRKFQEGQEAFYRSLLMIWGLGEVIEPKILGNMAFSILMLHNSSRENAPFLFQDEMDETARLQIEALITYLEKMKR